MINSNTAEQRLSGIVALLAERERETKRLQALDLRIAELAGFVPEGQMRKPSKKNLSPKEFKRGCGVRG